MTPVIVSLKNSLGDVSLGRHCFLQAEVQGLIALSREHRNRFSRMLSRGNITFSNRAPLISGAYCKVLCVAYEPTVGEERPPTASAQRSFSNSAV